MQEHLICDVFYSSSALTQSVYLFIEIQSTVSSLISTTDKIQHELTTAQKNLTDAQDRCKNNGGASACNEIPVGNELTTDANFTKEHVYLIIFNFLFRSFVNFIYYTSQPSKNNCRNKAVLN